MKEKIIKAAVAIGFEKFDENKVYFGAYLIDVREFENAQDFLEYLPKSILIGALRKSFGI